MFDEELILRNVVLLGGGNGGDKGQKLHFSKLTVGSTVQIRVIVLTI